MLVNLEEILKQPYADKTAVGAFNCYSFETIKSVIESAEEEQAPVIVAFGAKYLVNMNLESVVAIVKSLADKTSQQVCLHLDHCSDITIIYQAIKAGFTSVMYDGSMLSYEENIKNSQKVVEVAHAVGVSVEAELGSLATGLSSHEGRIDDSEVYTDPAQAQEFVERTGVDALAVSIGTVHGVYKGTPNIRIDILEKINQVTPVPLVLHGGSGTPEEKLKASIQNGIAKINVNTEISTYTVEKTKELLAQESPHLSVLYLQQQEDIKEIVKKYIEMYG